MGKDNYQGTGDEDFKVRLIAEPAAVLKEEGIVVPDGITIKVMEDTESVTHVVIL